jgi:signal transduction histidine kinase
MARRVAATAALAIALTVAAGICTWLVRVRAVADAVVQQGQLARVLIDASAPFDEKTARSLWRPGLSVVVFDEDAGRLIEARNGTYLSRALPPGPEGAPPGGPPGAGNGLPAPGIGLPGPGNAQQPHSFVASVAGALAHIAPAHVEGDILTITVSPDTDSLGLWLACDAAAVVLGVIALAGIAAARAAGHVRAERRLLEAKSEERREAAERYQRFLAETAHELRTPLTIVSGYVDILRASRGGVQAFDERIVEGLRAETARMRVLVAKMLTLARLESPAGVPRLLDVAGAAQASLETMRRRYPERTISLLAADAGSIVIDADDFADALGNLVENALKYAPGTEVAIAVSAHEGRTSISVSDRGPGVAADERERIFERFYRGRDRSETEGLGLGLAIVKGVTERWGGEVRLESVPGRTVFTLTFPLADEEVHALAR